MNLPPNSTDPREINAMARLAAQETGRVMVRDESRDGFGPRARRHLKLYLDGPHDVYVRTGKRGQCIERLTSYRVSCVDPLVVCFTSSPRSDDDAVDAGQRAWEIAMGMRGYPGSPAEREASVCRAR